jgi:hypothetical protein
MFFASLLQDVPLFALEAEDLGGNNPVKALKSNPESD